MKHRSRSICSGGFFHVDAYVRLVVLFALLSVVSCAPGRVKMGEVRPGRVVTHRVLPGESWESISRDYYGTVKRADELAEYNGMKLDDELEPGTGVRIPLRDADIKYLRRKARAVGAYNEGLELVSLGKFAGAIEKFREALKLDSSLSDAEFNTAVCYQKLGMHEKALGILDPLIDRVGGNEKYLFALGNSQFHLKKYRKAAETFEKVLSLNPGNAKALFSLAVAYERMGRKDEAVQTWRRYLRLDDSSEWAESARRHIKELTGGGDGDS